MATVGAGWSSHRAPFRNVAGFIHERSGGLLRIYAAMPSMIVSNGTPRLRAEARALMAAGFPTLLGQASQNAENSVGSTELARTRVSSFPSSPLPSLPFPSLTGAEVGEWSGEVGGIPRIVEPSANGAGIFDSCRLSIRWWSHPVISMYSLSFAEYTMSRSALHISLSMSRTSSHEMPSSFGNTLALIDSGENAKRP